MKDTGWVSATEFFRHPWMVGSGFPATARMVRHVLSPLDCSAFRVVVEFGPGSGRFTFEMLRRMGPDATLVAIEIGEAFVEELQSKCDDPRLIVVKGSATDVRGHLDAYGLDKADCILSGLPFSTLEAREAETIMRESAGTLAASGTFTAYQMRSAIRPLINRHFNRVRLGYEWWNIPPVTSIGRPSLPRGRLNSDGFSINFCRRQVEPEGRQKRHGHRAIRAVDRRSCNRRKTFPAVA